MRPTRHDLARWLTDPANPLTPRVTVNRVWKHLFGEGLVRTVGDFGHQGEKPTHPELLDWLATEFIARKWSQKELIKLIVTSAAYRQSSAHRPELVERDAQNRLLARQNRFRLPAENVRDQYLAAGGLLDRQVGGPSVPLSARRRGLYVQFKRSTPEAMLVTFDAPAATVTCPARERSNTPLQALTLLNDPLFVDCARNLARQALTEPEGDDRLNRLFALCRTRTPDAVERQTLLALFERSRERFTADPAAAAKLFGPNPPPGVPPADAAAWVVVARAVLNLDEVVTRE
jgi:hypothetical protein